MKTFQLLLANAMFMLATLPGPEMKWFCLTGCAALLGWGVIASVEVYELIKCNKRGEQ